MFLPLVALRHGRRMWPERGALLWTRVLDGEGEDPFGIVDAVVSADGERLYLIGSHNSFDPISTPDSCVSPTYTNAA